METGNFAPIDLHAEYRRTLLAVRVAATMFILLAATWCWLQHSSIGQSVQVFENMVAGGFDAMPSLTKLVINYSDAIAAAAALGGLGALAVVWLFGHRMSQVIYAGTAGVLTYLLVGSVIYYALQQPLITIITKFNG
jgi:hypothetical protein